MTPFQRLLARECYQQAKTIHKLLLTLSDDLGDMSIQRDVPPDFAALADLVSGKLEPTMQSMRDALNGLSQDD